MKKNLERRKEPRYKLKVAEEAQVEDSNFTYKAQLVDLSESGLRLKFEYDPGIQIGKSYKIQFSQKHWNLILQAEVRWAKEIDKKINVGFKIVKADIHTKKSLGAILQELKKA